MENDIKYVLKSREEIESRVKEIASELNEKYRDKNPIFVSILKGSFMFMADLMREINIFCNIDFMAVSSYGSGSSTSGEVRISKDTSQALEGRHVIIVEDILDSGLTLQYLKKHILSKEPASLSVCVLLDKKGRRVTEIDADYVCFSVPDEYIVGYGLDYDQKYRNLPYIGVLKPEIYTK